MTLEASELEVRIRNAVQYFHLIIVAPSPECTALPPDDLIYHQAHLEIIISMNAACVETHYCFEMCVCNLEVHGLQEAWFPGVTSDMP